MNKQDYLQEALKQLSNSNHYETLKEDPTQEYNNQIYQVLQQAVNLTIIDGKGMKTLYNKSPRTPFICYQRHVNPTTQEDILLMKLEALWKKFQHM